MSDVLNQYAERKAIANSPSAEIARLEAELGISPVTEGAIPKVQPPDLGSAPKPQGTPEPKGTPTPESAPAPTGQDPESADAQAAQIGLKKEKLAGPMMKSNDPAKTAKLKINSLSTATSFYGTEALANQALGGVADTFQEIGNFAIDAMDQLDNFALRNGITSKDFVDPKNRLDFAKQWKPESDDPVQQTTRGIFRFLVPMRAAMLAGGAVAAGGKVAQTIAGGGTAAAMNFAAFDPHEQRLSNLVQQYPNLRNPVSQYLAADPGDTNMEGRLKNMLENTGIDLALGGAFMGVMGGYKAVRTAAGKTFAPLKKAVGEAAEGVAQAAKKAVAPAEGAAKPTAEGVLEATAKEADEVGGALPGAADTPPAATVVEDAAAVPEGTPAPAAPETPAVVEAPKPEPLYNMLDPEELGAPRPGDTLEKSVNINLAKLETTDDVRALVKNFTEENRDMIAEARRVGPDKVTVDAQTGESFVTPASMPIEDTKEMARLAAQNPDLIANWKPGTAYNAEEIHAISMIYNASGETMARMSKKLLEVREGFRTGALTEDAVHAAVYEYKQAMDNFANVSKVKAGATAESGRALRIQSETVKQEFDPEMLARIHRVSNDLSGGIDEIMDQADLLGSMFDEMDRLGKSKAEGMEKVLKKGFGAVTRDALYEVWINGLLSSPKTQVVNAGANALTFLNEVAERRLAAGFGMIRTGLKAGAEESDKVASRILSKADRVRPGEATAMLKSADEVLEEATSISLNPGGFWDPELSEPAIKSLTSIEGMIDGLVAGRKAFVRSVENFTKDAARAGEKAAELAKQGIDKVKEDGLLGTAKDAADSFVNWEKRTAQLKGGVKDNLGIEPAITAENMLSETAPEGVKRAVDVLGSVVRMPGRLMHSNDQFFKNVRYRAEVHAQAIREIEQRGLTGEKASTFLRDFIDDPPESVVARSQQAAEKTTFTNDLEGFHKAIYDAINNTKVFGVAPLRAIAPFSKTGLNILQYSYEHGPLAPMTARFRRDIAAGGAKADMAMARWSMGIGYTTVASYLYGSGKITGSGPQNPDENKMWLAQGYQPYSVKVGDQWVSYRRADPFAKMLALTADISELHGRVGMDNLEAAGKVAGLTAIAVANSVTPELLTNQMTDFLAAMKDPQGHAMQTFFTNMAATTVPFSSLNREVRRTGIPGIVEGDMVKRDTKPDPDSHWKFLEETVNKMKSNIPGLSKDLPPMRNIFGDVMTYPSAVGPDIVSPFAATEVDKSPGMQEIYRLMMDTRVAGGKEEGETDLSIRMPRRDLKVPGTDLFVKMTPKQYDNYIKLSAGDGLSPNFFGGQTLKEAFNKEVENNWPSLGQFKNDENKRARIKEIVGQYRKAAAMQLKITDEDIQEKMRQEQIDSMNVRTRTE